METLTPSRMDIASAACLKKNRTSNKTWLCPNSNLSKLKMSEKQGESTVILMNPCVVAKERDEDTLGDGRSSGRNSTNAATGHSSESLDERFANSKFVGLGGGEGGGSVGGREGQLSDNRAIKGVAEQDLENGNIAAASKQETLAVPPPAVKSKKLAHLDGLRGWASLCVFIGHVGSRLCPDLFWNPNPPYYSTASVLSHIFLGMGGRFLVLIFQVHLQPWSNFETHV